MGTNYYRVNLPTEEDIKKMHEMVDARMFESRRGYWDDNKKYYISDDEVTCVQEFIEDCTKEVHICKMSYGWKTCFDHNWGKYYQPNRKSLEEFLSEPNTIIRDEYGEEISFEDFWKLVEDRDSARKSDGEEPFVSKTYVEWEKSRGNYCGHLCTEDIRKCKEVFNVEPEDNDFEVDNLRFAVYSDFC